MILISGGKCKKIGTQETRKESIKVYIYMQSNKIHNVILMSKFYSALKLARHVSDLIGPSSGAFCTSCIRRLWYVVIRVLLDTSSRCNAITPYQSLRIQLIQTLLMMDRCPKHVELTKSAE